MIRTRPPERPAPPKDAAEPQRPLDHRKVGQILPAATDLFLEHGFDLVTMDMVTAASGVSKSTLYVYFKSKEDLFVTVLTEESRRLNAEIWVPDQDTQDVETVLRRVARNFFAVFMTERAFAIKRIILGALPRFPDVGRITFELGPATIIGEIAAFLAKARDDGRLDFLPNPSLAASQFLNLVRSDAEVKGLLSLEPPSQAEIDERIESAVSMFLSHHRRT